MGHSASKPASGRKILAARKKVKPKALTADGLTLARKIKRARNRFAKAVKEGDKEVIRQFHLRAKSADSLTDYELIYQRFEKYRSWFADPASINVAAIRPRLVLVEKRSLEEQLFKICRAYWSMPYSKGYGRRLRYLVVDDAHRSVMGIIGLQSPPADLSCRDAIMACSQDRKLLMVNSTLDAYTVGAVPPYSELIGGKLIAGFLASETVRRDYWRLYGSKRTQMLNRRLPQPLLAITTTSAFGRSSIYNRLRFGKNLLAESIGYTKGFGTIHFEHLYAEIQSWLTKRGLLINGGYGNGPKVRWQNIVRAMQALSISGEPLKHGLEREVFLFRHVSNFEAVCRDGATPEPLRFSDAEWSEYWKARWAIPRAISRPEWTAADPSTTIGSALKRLL